MKIALAATPGCDASGMRTFFRTLVTGLAPQGHEVIGVSFPRARSAETRCDTPHRYVALSGPEHDPRTSAKRFVSFCHDEQVDIVVPNNSPEITSAIPFLPRRTRVVMRCNSCTADAYKFVSSYPERVSAWIAISRRQVMDLSAAGVVPSARLHLVPNGPQLPESPALHLRRARREGEPLRLIFVGRLHHASKGILQIPDILRLLRERGVPFTLDVVGGGRDEEAFHRSASEFASAITCHGALPPAGVREALRQAEVLLMPSRYEGFGWVAAEAMSAGVVPVVSRIRGVLDWIVVDGRSGFVCPIHDRVAYADALSTLATEPGLLQKMGRSARLEARLRFSRGTMLRRYEAIFESAVQAPNATLPSPRPWTEWKPHEPYRAVLRDRIAVAMRRIEQRRSEKRR